MKVSIIIQFMLDLDNEFIFLPKLKVLRIKENPKFTSVGLKYLYCALVIIIANDYNTRLQEERSKQLILIPDLKIPKR